MATTRRPKYRSGLERLAAGCLVRAGLDKHFHYEPYRLQYYVPSTTRMYLPDWAMGNEEQSIILETKGRFTSQDRKKMLLIKESHPKRTFVMIFGAPHNKIAKQSKTTYAMWCDKNNLLWCDIADFEKDPITCLSAIIPNFKVGNVMNPRKKKSKP